MKKAGLAAALLLVATASFADDSAYRFRASWATDHFEFAGLHGTHWKWLNFGCPKDVSCEVSLDTRGANQANADLAIAHVSDQTLRARCLREEGCHLVITADREKIEKTLNRDDATDFASGSVVSISASTHPSSSESH